MMTGEAFPNKLLSEIAGKPSKRLRLPLLEFCEGGALVPRKVGELLRTVRAQARLDSPVPSITRQVRCLPYIAAAGMAGSMMDTSGRAVP